MVFYSAQSLRGRRLMGNSELHSLHSRYRSVYPIFRVTLKSKPKPKPFTAQAGDAFTAVGKNSLGS